MCQFLLYDPNLVGWRLMLVVPSTYPDITLNPNHAAIMKFFMKLPN